MKDTIKNLHKEVKKTLGEKTKNGEPISAMEMDAVIHKARMANELSEMLEHADNMKREPKEDKKEDGVVGHLNDEIEGGEEYFTMWQKTGIPSYKQMAKDEFRHAEFFHAEALKAGELTADQSTAIERELAMWAQKLV